MGKTVMVNDDGRVIGEGHHRAKLTDEQVEMILYLRFEAKLSYRRIVDKFDDPAEHRPALTTVRDICQGLRRAQTGYWRKA